MQKPKIYLLNVAKDCFSIINVRDFNIVEVSNRQSVAVKNTLSQFKRFFCYCFGKMDNSVVILNIEVDKIACKRFLHVKLCTDVYTF